MGFQLPLIAFGIYGLKKVKCSRYTIQFIDNLKIKNMKNNTFLKSFILTLGMIVYFQAAFPCSMYKITVNGKTMVGNNEDSWGEDAKIWFEPGKNGKFGFVGLGYARKKHPDGAMNEHGLAFDAFAMLRKGTLPDRDPKKKDFAYGHIRTIMQECKTVDEVYAFLAKLNLHILDGSPIFNGSMLLFADKTGKYLVVEADKMTLGNEEKFVLANFSVADTKDLSTIKLERYCKGVAFLKNKPLDVKLSFCTALSDTMSVNRAKIGDGTLYTNILDLNEGIIHLYFFHDFSKRITFNLKEELGKGVHSHNFSDLFPMNEKYEKFIAYKTPQNSKFILIFIISCGVLFFSTFTTFLINFFKSSNKNYKYFKLAISALSILLCIYTYVLIRNQGIFYFPSPYNDGYSLVVALTSYLPFILLIAITPFLVFTIKIFRQNLWSNFLKYLLVINNLAYIVLIGLFIYWKLFDVFN